MGFPFLFSFNIYFFSPKKIIYIYIYKYNKNINLIVFFKIYYLSYVFCLYDICNYNKHVTIFFLIFWSRLVEILGPGKRHIFSSFYGPVFKCYMLYHWLVVLANTPSPGAIRLIINSVFCLQS